MPNMFTFKANRYTDAFAEHGYVHIPGGLSEEFHAQLVKYVQDSFEQKHLKDFARGDKQQAMFEFLEPEHYDELREAVATITGVEMSSLTLSERHIKGMSPVRIHIPWRIRTALAPRSLSAFQSLFQKDPR